MPWTGPDGFAAAVLIRTARHAQGRPARTCSDADGGPQRQGKIPLGTVLRCQTARNFDPRLECTPAGGQGQGADLTIFRACSFSNDIGLRYPRAECSRLLL
jgi:hypothetical protein